MSKAILVMDMPRSCLECHLSTDEGFRCIFLVGKSECSIEKRLDNCPLRELPKKKEVCGKYPQADKIPASYKVGYNACIDEILRCDKNEDN